jgi:hypothetical protein
VPKKKAKLPLSKTHPKLAKETDGWDLSTTTFGSQKIFLWKCSKGHRWESSPLKRAIRGQGCPFCSGHRLLIGFNDLATTHPAIAIEANGWDPTKFGKGFKKKVSWICPNGHIYEASIDSRTNMNSGCSYCSGKKVLIGFNDLRSLSPQIAKEADGWDPSTVTFGSNKKLNWKCASGHRYKATVNQRTKPESGTNCPICANQKILSGVNDLATRFPLIALEAYDWDPINIGAGSKKKLTWKCSKNHFYDASPESRTQKMSGCPICAGLKVLIGFNDLATTHPEISTEADGWDTTKVIAGTSKKFKWKCQKGHKYVASVNKRTERNQGCPTCAKYGFDPNSDAYLYFLTHTQWKMLQIGITNFPEDRIRSHKNLGWSIIEIRGPMDGHLTQQWETAILRMLKAKGADLSNKEIAGKFDGYSEAWSKSTFPVKSIKELMKLTEEFEEGK